MPEEETAATTLDPPKYHGISLFDVVHAWAWVSTVLAGFGFPSIAILNKLERSGNIEFHPNDHSALMTFAAVNLITCAVLWIGILLARRQDRQHQLAEERHAALRKDIRDAQVRHDARTAALVDEFAGRMLALEGQVTTLTKAVPGALDAAKETGRVLGYDQGYLHGSTGQAPKSRLNGNRAPLRPV